ncbi:MAG TPA: DoxX family protein [Candidatus Paceibacterota bacterium]|nr:DoxX family protein [Candidatus Paceibacterota bacterium]
MQPYINTISRFFYNRSLGLLLIRVAAGSIFLLSGWSKLADMSGTITAFDGYGFSPLFAVLIAWFEVLGGLSLILGIAPRPVAGLLGIEMLAAALLLNGARGFAGVQLELLLAAVAFGIMLLGSGKYALYKMECNTCNGLFCIKKNRVCVMAPTV